MKKLVLNEQIEVQSSYGPPKEVMLIKFGRTVTTKGDYFFDRESAAKVLARYESRGLHLNFDYNHLSIDPSNEEQGKAAGWYDLALRDDGLWAVNITWTPRASDMILNKEYLYISPAIALDNEKKVVRLINVALTNLPATDELEPLTRLEEELLIATKPGEKTVNSKVLRLEEKMEEMKHLELAKKHLKSYCVHSSKAMLESGDDDLKSMYKDHHSRAMKLAEEVKGHMKRLDPGMPDGDEDDMTEEQTIATLSESIKQLTGKDNESEQLMVLTAYKNAVETVALLTEENDGLEKKIVALKDEMTNAEKIQLIDQAISGKEKKLFPKQRVWALSLNLDQLKAYLEATPVLNVNTKYEQPIVALVEDTSMKLEDTDKAVIKFMEKAGIKIDEAKYLADKKIKLGIK
jgi:phage I-like protein